jgi:hypothetical protein
MANMKMLNKSRVFKYVPNSFNSKVEFEDSTEQQFHRLFGRYMHEGEFNNLCWWCRRHPEMTDEMHGYRLLLGRMGRSRLDETLPRYMFLRRGVGGRYRRFNNRELTTGQLAVSGHSNGVTSHIRSIVSTLISLEMGVSDPREKHIFNVLRNAVERGRMSTQTASRLITSMVGER